MTESRQQGSRSTRKIAAIAAGLLVVGVGATYTLASWTDSEWVWGGTDGGDAGIGTSSFAIDQSHDGGDNWLNEPAADGENLTFTGTPLALTPGDSIYAPVTIATTPASIAGEVLLEGADPAVGATANDLGNQLWDALELAVYTSSAASVPTCDATTIADAGSDWSEIPGFGSLSAGASEGETQSLSAERGSLQHYCFEITLPEVGTNDLQGLTVAPAWEFSAVSE